MESMKIILHGSLYITHNEALTTLTLVMKQG